jgi:hypothetical protein
MTTINIDLERADGGRIGQTPRENRIPNRNPSPFAFGSIREHRSLGPGYNLILLRQRHLRQPKPPLSFPVMGEVS